MGIKGLTKLLADNAPKAMKEQKFESYFGRKIAVDASMSIYQFLIVVGRTGMETLTNEAGEVTSHLQGMFNRTIRLLEAGIKPVYVFDGKPPDLKKQELAKRYSKREDATKELTEAVEEGDKDAIEKLSKRTVKVTRQHNDDCKKLLRLMGVPVVEAPCEAEAECAALCTNDKVYAVASEDMDSLTFGAPRFLRHLMDPSSKKIPVMEFDVAKVCIVVISSIITFMLHICHQFLCCRFWRSLNSPWTNSLICASSADVTIVIASKVLGGKQL
ncbi:hypothetical protein SEVIR_3G167500v4 [Setaria viridis]